MKPIDRQEYVALCRSRWSDWCLADARRNFAEFEELSARLEPFLRDYAHDPCMEDVTGKCHNPDGTLTALLWKLQDVLQENKSCLHPFLDFNEDSQTIFLRRGLLFYCQLLLRGNRDRERAG